MREKNLELYNRVAAVPQEAQKKITGGRLNGMTNISPMWRIKKLTEEFGMAGFGWIAPITRTWLDETNGEVIVNIEIALKVKVNGEWSEGITGLGGSKLKAKEKETYYANDEAYKNAYTDAISVACKALGIGADVYWDSDTTKYDRGKVEGKQGKGKKDKQASKFTLDTNGKTKWQIANEMLKGSKYTLASLERWQMQEFGEVKHINKLSDEQFALMVEVINNSLEN